MKNTRTFQKVPGILDPEILLLMTCAEEAPQKDPHYQAVCNHQDHVREDSKSDQVHVWIRVCFVLASLHEIGATSSPAK